jgi:tRNA modification GTPase
MGSDEVARHPVARETIAAIATPAGRGGIGVVRVSGPLAPRIAQQILGALPAARHATRAIFRDAHAAALDEGLALYFPAPNSYTGEHVLELQGHGGPAVLRSVLAACIGAGARLAEPGEFTQRAFLEGKLDLAQAEAVADLIDAASREAARSALRSLQGEFSSAIHRVVDGLLELRALIEAMLDFPEEEVEALHRDDAAARLAKLCAAVEDLLARGRRGRLLSGIHVVIAGRPNVGKSSLLNRLSGEERAIVTPVAGTTRDVLREPLEIDGVPLVLVDTAGLRAASADAIEAIGMERARAELQRADVVLVVRDACAPEDVPPDLPRQGMRLEVYNKIDLAPGFRVPEGSVAVSARTGENVEVLRQAILRAAGWSHTGETAFLARERHLHALTRALQHLREASRTDRLELFAEELRLAQAALGEITGQVAPDELLGEIFARFCIGK